MSMKFCFFGKTKLLAKVFVLCLKEVVIVLIPLLTRRFEYIIMGRVFLYTFNVAKYQADLGIMSKFKLAKPTTSRTQSDVFAVSIQVCLSLL